MPMSSTTRAPRSALEPAPALVGSSPVLVGVVFVQLALSLRFFAEYVGSWAWPFAYALYVLVGTGAAVAVLRVRRVRRAVSSVWALGLAVVSLVALDSVAYPRADALREVGRGSDQDDCARRMVHNVFAGREPFAEGYFGDPCSTGPSEFFVYFPVQVWNGWFVVMPALVVLLGYAMLRVLVDTATAVLLSLTQFSSWMFLELSAVGSDLLVIGWMFGVAVAASYVHRGHDGLVVAGVAAYVFVAGSRVPLAVVVAASLVLLLLASGRRALRVVVPVVLATGLLYLGGYALAPDHFTPGHLVTKSINIVRYLGTGSLLSTMVVLALVVLVLALVLAVLLHDDPRAVVRRHFLSLQVVLMLAPLVAVAAWDLLRRDGQLAEWEAWHYLWLCVPALLVAAADRIGGGPAARSGSPGSRGQPTSEPDGSRSRARGRRAGPPGTGPSLRPRRTA